jgi:hypothetical protein
MIHTGPESSDLGKELLPRPQHPLARKIAIIENIPPPEKVACLANVRARPKFSDKDVCNVYSRP